MKKLTPALAFVFLAAPVFADAADPPANVVVSLTQTEAQVLIGLLDTAVKSCGISCAGNAAFLGGKVQEAITVANASPAVKK